MAVLQTKTLSQGCSNDTGYTLKLTLTEDSINISGNYSSISYKLELISTTYNYQQWGTGYTVTINGTVVASQERGYDHQTSINKNSSITLCSGTTTVIHNDDGTKTISASNIGATLDIGGSPAPGPITISGSSWTLTTIARKSTLTIGNGTLGSNTSLTVNAKSADFKHNIKYSCGSSTNVSMFSNATASSINNTGVFKFPLSLASQNTTGTTVSVTVTLETLNGSTSLGTNTYTISMSIPSSVKPSISASNITVTDDKNHLTTYKTYVQNQSTISVSATADASSSYGATVSITVQIKKSSTVLKSGSSISQFKLTESGTITIYASATDTRGRSANASKTITVAAYSPPAITKLSAYRTNSSGTALANGTYARIKFSANGTPLTTSGTNYNTMTYTIYYKAKSAGSYSNTSAGNSNAFNATDVYSSAFGGGNIAVTSSYLVYLTAKDKFNTTTSVVVTIPSQEVFFKADPVNKALSFGKIETVSNKLSVGWQSEFDGNIILNNNATIENLKVPSQKYYSSSDNYGLDMNNSDLIKANGIYFGDPSDQPFNEGIHFPRSTSSSTTYDTIYCRDGSLLLMPGHPRNENGNAYTILNTSNTKRYVTTAQVGTNYRVNRWSDGLEEFWCTDIINVTGWKTWGNIYEANVYRQFGYGSYPFKAYTYPMVTASVSASFGLCGCELYIANSSRWQYSPRIYPLRPINDSTGEVYVSLHAVGVYTASQNLIPPVKSGSYSGVTTTLNMFSGKTSISGTATATGGHGTLMSNTVTLEPGTYQVQVATTGANSCKDAWIRSPNTNHAQLTIGSGGTYTGTFTISSSTSGVYASIRVESGVTYSGSVDFSLFKTS